MIRSDFNNSRVPSNVIISKISLMYLGFQFNIRTFASAMRTKIFTEILPSILARMSFHNENLIYSRGPLKF